MKRCIVKVKISTKIAWNSVQFNHKQTRRLAFAFASKKLGVYAKTARFYTTIYKQVKDA